MMQTLKPRLFCRLIGILVL